MAVTDAILNLAGTKVFMNMNLAAVVGVGLTAWIIYGRYRKTQNGV